jgi:hypothetical protein
MNLLSFRFPDICLASLLPLTVQTKLEQKQELEEESRDKLISIELLCLVNGHSAPRGEASQADLTRDMSLLLASSDAQLGQGK